MAVMIGIGAMMGPGIFALPGELAHMIGPLGILVYLALGMVTIITAVNYSELGAAIPIAGGGYSFVSRTLPKPIAFFTGWFFWIGNTVACSLYVIIFALTIRTYIWHEANVAVLVVSTTLLFAFINWRGMSEAIKVITAMNLIELVILIGVALLGISEIEGPNLKPFAPFGYAPFLPAMALIYVSYVGYELITVASEEIINPGKTIPRAIMITMIVAITIYVLVVWVMMGTVHYSELAESEVPFIYAAERIFGNWGRLAAVTATIMACLSAFSVTLGASARVLYALGRDGHFPQVLARLHSRYRTPDIALLTCTVMVIAFGAVGIVRFAASMSDFGFLMGLGFVNMAVIALHRKMPNLRRPYKVALYPLLPILGILTSWLFVPALETRSFVIGGLLTLIGASIYLWRPANRRELQLLGRVVSRISFNLKKIPKMRILIIGGGRQGRNIADRLLAKDEYRLLFRTVEHQVTFIEENETRCKELESRYPVPIFHGDGTKKEILEQVGLQNVDIAIAATNDDSRNTIISMQAKHLGINRVISIIHDSDYVPLLEENDIVCISAPWSTAAMVENHLDRPGVAQLFEIGTGVASLLGVPIRKDSHVVDMFIRDISIPKECVVAAVIRKNKFVVPRGNTQIKEGDRVIFVGPEDAIQNAQKIFNSSK